MICVNARFVTQNLTGVQRFALEISKELKRIDNNIIFVAPKSEIINDLYKDLKIVYIGNHKGYIWEQIDLYRFLKKNNSPLLINLCNTAPVFYRNKISTIHDVTFVKYPKMYSFVFRMVYKFLIPFIIHTSRHIFTVSEFSKKEILSCYHVKEDKIDVVYNAVASKFSKELDKSLRTPQYFLAVSSIKENKNLLCVLNAFICIQDKLPNVNLYLVGDMKNNNFSKIDISKYFKNNRIKFLGRVSDEKLIKLYSNAIAFIFPSFYEGFGIPVLEAQSCGCPVISSNSSSLPEVLNNSALYFDPTNQVDLQKNMIKIYVDSVLCKDLEKKGYENVCRFSWRSGAEKIHLCISHLKQI